MVLSPYIDEMNKIATIKSDFPTKFGIPKQSGIAKSLLAKIVFEPEYRDPEALRGLEETSHIWLIWEFSEAKCSKFSPTVRPPRLGGNKRLGVFATRSPFRPNPIGLSCVEIVDIKLHTAEGPVIIVSGADLMDGTPIFDIKPYIPYADSFPDAKCGFVDTTEMKQLDVEIPQSMLYKFPKDKATALREILAEDPRPRYQNDSERRYGFVFAGYEIEFTVTGNKLCVTNISPKRD